MSIQWPAVTTVARTPGFMLPFVLVYITLRHLEKWHFEVTPGYICSMLLCNAPARRQYINANVSFNSAGHRLRKSFTPRRRTSPWKRRGLPGTTWSADLLQRPRQGGSICRRRPVFEAAGLVVSGGRFEEKNRPCLCNHITCLFCKFAL